jgi:hypothetical protein
MLSEDTMFRVAYATAPDERRFSDAYTTLDEARKEACALLAEHGNLLAVDIRMNDTMVLIGADEIRQWCAARKPS